MSKTLGLAVFQSAEPSFDINSPGLCGTYSFEIDGPEEVAAEEASEVPDTAAVARSWRVRTETNPIDDKRTVIRSLAAEGGTSHGGKLVTFIARCQSNRTEAYAVWGDHLGDDSRSTADEWTHVTVRVGSNAAWEEKWEVSTDREATFVPSWAGNFLKELLDEERLVLQTIPYGVNPVTAVFDVSGLRGVLGELSRTCNWSF